MPTSAPLGHLLPWEGGRIPLHELPIQMAFDTKMPLPNIRHFERKREIFFVRGKTKAVRGPASGKHPAPCAPKKRCFMQTAPRRKKNTANEKDPSAALGMTIRECLFPTHDFQSLCDANLRPFGPPPSMGRRENAASQTTHTDGLQYENTVPPHSSFRAKARNLFRSREDKGCERNGKRETPCSLRPPKNAVSCRPFHAGK